MFLVTGGDLVNTTHRFSLQYLNSTEVYVLETMSVSQGGSTFSDHRPSIAHDVLYLSS
jgi:hypothetical protein